MSVTPAQLEHFAKFVTTHEAFPQFKSMIDDELFKLFVNAESDEKRLKVGYASDSLTILYEIIDDVLSEMADEQPVNDTKED